MTPNTENSLDFDDNLVDLGMLRDTTAKIKKEFA
jgi:hypothetical protein